MTTFNCNTIVPSKSRYFVLSMAKKSVKKKKSSKRRFELRKSLTKQKTQDPYSKIVLYNAKTEVFFCDFNYNHSL